MSQPLTLARPYARAAFELAREQRALGDWSRNLAFAAQAAADPRVIALFGDPRVEPRQLAALCAPAGESADAPFARFLALLADNGRLRALPEIGALFEQYKRDAESVLQVRVRSATPIDAAEVERLKTALRQRYRREIELEQALDPTVLGGAVIDAGDQVIDGSVRGRLARLEQALAQ